MAERGIYFSLEALLAFLVLVLLILSTSPSRGEDLKELYLAQKQHDLLLVWLQTCGCDLDGMEQDFRRVFPGMEGAFSFDTQSRVIGGGAEPDKPGRRALRESVMVAAPSGKAAELSLVLYLD